MLCRHLPELGSCPVGTVTSSTSSALAMSYSWVLPRCAWPYRHPCASCPPGRGWCLSMFFPLLELLPALTTGVAEPRWCPPACRGFVGEGLIQLGAELCRMPQPQGDKCWCPTPGLILPWGSVVSSPRAADQMPLFSVFFIWGGVCAEEQNCPGLAPPGAVAGALQPIWSVPIGFQPRQQCSRAFPSLQSSSARLAPRLSHPCLISPCSWGCLQPCCIPAASCQVAPAASRPLGLSSILGAAAPVLGVLGAQLGLHSHRNSCGAGGGYGAAWLSQRGIIGTGDG